MATASAFAMLLLGWELVGCDDSRSGSGGGFGAGDVDGGGADAGVADAGGADADAADADVADATVARGTYDSGSTDSEAVDAAVASGTYDSGPPDSDTVDAGPSCTDRLQNGDETDEDCGGVSCGPCPAGSSCLTNDDCAGELACRTDSTCGCPKGYLGDGTGGCEDIDECMNGSSNCDQNATCTNTDGGFECLCDWPWIGDGETCVVCDDDPELCGDHGTCTPQSSGPSWCVCEDGYEWDGSRCRPFVWF